MDFIPFKGENHVRFSQKRTKYAEFKLICWQLKLNYDIS